MLAHGLRTFATYDGLARATSIAWLAHQLIGLTRDDAPVFDSIIVVTGKFQSGYDERALHTMYVDKTLSGIWRTNRLSPMLSPASPSCVRRLTP